MRTSGMGCLGLLLLCAAPASGVTEFQSVTLAKARYKAPAVAPPPDAGAETLFKTKFLAKGTFVLGSGSDGIDLANETVRVTAGDFSQTIGAGQMALSPGGVAKFRSKQLGSFKVVIVKPTATGFKWVVKGSKLLLPPPATLTLQIGDDAGSIDLATGAVRPLAAVVRGTMVSGDPVAGLDGVVITIPCPSGMCTTVTADGGRFELSASLGVQNMLQDGRGIAGGGYPRITQSVMVAPGVNDVGIFALPELDLSGGTVVSAGVQPATTAVTSNPLSTGGSVAMTIDAGATVTFPGGAAGQTVSISEVPLALIPMEFGSFVASPVVVTTQPGGATISPPADVTFPNPYPSMGDGEQLMIYGYNNAIGDWETIAVGTIQNGGSEIFAPAAIGEFAWYFPACTPVVTSVVGLATVNGSPMPGLPVLIQGRTVTTFAPAQDLDGDGQLDNFFTAGIAGGCPGLPFSIQTFFPSTILGGLITNSTSRTVSAVPGGITHVGTVALPILAACGNAVREVGEQCDAGDAAICPGQCAADCTCFQDCGNNVVELGEQCDGSADAACPGACAGDCLCPPTCGNDVLDAGEECDGADADACPGVCGSACTCPTSLTCPLATGSRLELRVAALPNPIDIPLTGDLDFACASFAPAAGPHACGCGPITAAPANLPGIGFFCIESLSGCPAGEISCAGGDARDVALTGDANLGACSDNAACAAQCAAACAPTAVVQSGCTGFCSLSGSPCTTDGQCLMFNEGLCNGSEPVSAPNVCQCQCVDWSAGGAAAPGALQCSLGVRISLETSAPCDGTDTTIRLRETCMALGTGTVNALIADANSTPGNTLGPTAHAGVPLTCEALGLSSGTASGLALRGASAFFGTSLGDLIINLRADCQ